MNHSLNEQLMARKAAATPRGVGVMGTSLPTAPTTPSCGTSRAGASSTSRGGIAVMNTGHRHPKVRRGARGATQRFTHTCYQVVPYESYVALAEKLNAMTPGTHAKKTALFSTGAEAIENAIKIARSHTKRSGVIAFCGAFHGRTLFAVALTGKVQPYKAGFGPFPPEIYHAPFPCRRREPRRHEEGRAAPLQGRHRAQPRRRHRLRAGAGRRRLQRDPGRRREVAARAVRRARHRADRRRSADRIRPHRQDVRDGALRRRARPHVHRQVARRRHAAVGGDGQGRDHGRARPRRPRRHLRRQPARHRRGACGDRRDGRGEPAGARRRRSATNSRPCSRACARRCRRSPTCAAWARWWRWSSTSAGSAEPDADFTKRVQAEALKRGLILLTCGVNANVRALPVPADDPGQAVFDEALDILREADPRRRRHDERAASAWRAQGVHTLLVQFTDMHGVAKGKSCRWPTLTNCCATGAGFSGPSIAGTGLPRMGRAPSTTARGLAEHRAPLPWMPGFARIVCDGYVAGAAVRRLPAPGAAARSWRASPSAAGRCTPASSRSSSCCAARIAASNPADAERPSRQALLRPEEPATAERVPAALSSAGLTACGLDVLQTRPRRRAGPVRDQLPPRRRNGERRQPDAFQARRARAGRSSGHAVLDDAQAVRQPAGQRHALPCSLWEGAGENTHCVFRDPAGDSGTVCRRWPGSSLPACCSTAPRCARSPRPPSTRTSG